MINRAARAALSRAVAKVRSRGLSVKDAQTLTDIVASARAWSDIPTQWMELLSEYMPAKYLPEQTAARAAAPNASTAARNEIERRTITADSLELREDGRTFTGYAALYDSPSAGLGFTEVIKPGAFNRTLSRAKRGETNIVALYGHDELSFLGSTASGALKLESDTRGLRVELKLPETQLGNDLAALFRAGEAPAMGMSFGFSVPSKSGERWSTDGTTRELTELRLHEVSLLSGGQTPAYPGTIGLGSVRAMAQRLGVEPEVARDAIDALLSGALDEARTAILVRAIGGAPEAPAAEPAPDAIIEEVQTADEAPSQAEPAVPTSTLVALGEVRFRAK